MSSQTLNLAKIWSNSRGETSSWSTHKLCVEQDNRIYQKNQDVLILGDQPQVPLFGAP